MDSDIVIFGLICFSCLTRLIQIGARRHSGVRGWVVIYLAVLLLSLLGYFLREPSIVYAAAILWLLFAVLPGLIARLYYRRFVQQQYSSARRLAWVVSWLHPADGWREQPEIVRAFELAHQGESAAAMEILKRHSEVKSLIGLVAIANLYRITGEWEQLIAWRARHGDEVDNNPQFLPIILRALGEIGDLRGMAELYGQRRQQIGKLQPTSRDICRLMLLAFCGRRQAVESICMGRLAILPDATRTFWIATAGLAAGALDSAKEQLKNLSSVADPVLRNAIERRLTMEMPSLADFPEKVIEEALRDQAFEERFPGRRSLFSSRARATQIVIGLNLAVFAAEIHQGGSTDPKTLYDLGALFAPAVHGGEWWRLIASLFLHFGVLHLTLNMLALVFLGPFVEYALGFRRYLLVYMSAGIGSMAMVLALSSELTEQHFTVGASGSIMGLVGATGALMLRSWLRDKSLLAKDRLLAMIWVISAQCIFDFVVPHVSMTAHLSGAFLGFAVAMVLRERQEPTTLQKTALNA